MKKYTFPKPATWPELARRPESPQHDLEALVDEVFAAVAADGDEAVSNYNLRFDKQQGEALQVTPQKIAQATIDIPDALKTAIELAKSNIEKFHKAQADSVLKMETTEGVTCWLESRAIESVGLYIPGGSAPLCSTVLMLGIPARLAGCRQITLCTPADKEGNIDPAILYIASLVGISQIFAVGGIQAIAAMSLGTATIPKADKIFGPGNQYVTAAKQKAQQLSVAIDMPAGPSEVLIIADESCDPSFVAADLLAQAEHGPDSQVILLSDNETVIDACLQELTRQLQQLPRNAIASNALANSKAIVFDTLKTCMDFSNRYAPEHLILALSRPADHIADIVNAGSVFLGNYSCESAGDYASGTNHTLPTNGHARSHSGVSLDSFVKKITFQELSPKGIQKIGPAIELMAEAEQLWGHKNAVTLRLKSLQNV